jgi:hypothetical protein
MTSVAFVIIFCQNLVKTTEDENECNTRNHLFCKGTRVKKKKKKKRVDVHLLATYALIIFLKKVFYNNISATSCATLLQHRFYNIVFCSTASTSLLQHHLLQHCFNTTFATLSFVPTLQHCFCSTIFYSMASALEWRQGLGFLVGWR